MTKPTKWYVRPAKTRISLGMCPVWSESLLSAWRKLESFVTHWAHSEDSDQTGQMPMAGLSIRWGHSHFVGFVMRQLNFLDWLARNTLIQVFRQIRTNSKTVNIRTSEKIGVIILKFKQGVFTVE